MTSDLEEFAKTHDLTVSEVIRRCPELLGDLSLVSRFDQIRSEGCALVGNLSVPELLALGRQVRALPNLAGVLALFGLNSVLGALIEEAREVSDE